MPWKFWEEEAVPSLLRAVEEMVRADHHIILCQKGRFVNVGVGVDIDVSEPLPGTPKIPTPNHDLSIPLIYNRQHEVCTLCSSLTHTIDNCPCIPSIPKIETMVEKFQPCTLIDQNFTYEAPLAGLQSPRRSGFKSLLRRKGDSPHFLGQMSTLWRY